MVKIQKLKYSDVKRKNNECSVLKKSGIMYCLNCSKECSSKDGICPSCKKNKFLNIDVSEIIGGYIKLAENKKLKEHYKCYNPTSIVKMNDKKIIHTLLVSKHKVGIEKETVDKIYKANLQLLY